jgi:hypothetical protein
VEEDVKAAVESRLSGVAKPGVAVVRSAFRSDADLLGYLGDVFLTMPFEGFLT